MLPLSAWSSHAPLAQWRQRASRARALTRRDWIVVAESLLTLAGVGVAIRFAGVPRVAAWANRLDPGVAPQAGEAEIARLARLAGIAARFTPFKCLTRSLTLARVLARRGIAASVHIGVRPEGSALKAHAWVECRGRILNDSMRHVRQFAPLDRVLGGTPHA